MINNNIKLKENNFFLKKLSLEDFSKNYFNWFKDDEVRRFIKSRYNSRIELIKNTNIEIQKKNQIFFGIFIKKKKFHIGNVKFHNINLSKKTAFVGILIGEKKFRNKGYGRKAIKLGCDYLFKKFGILTFKLKVSDKNIIAIKSYIKNGFIIKKKINDEFLMYLDYKNNHFILGAAQFGDAYGISNKKNKLTRKNIISILNFARGKISEIDSAEDYNIENEIKKNFKNFIVNTKIDISFFKKPFSEIESYFKKINNKNKVNILFVRNLENDFKNIKKLNKILKLKRLNYINKIGISIYSYKYIKKLYKTIKYDVIQAPLNILDNRSDNYEIFFLKNNIDFYARSVFLQGLFFLNNQITNPNLIPYQNVIDNISNICKKININVYDLALSHVFSKKYIKKIIIGAHEPYQLKKCLNFKYKENIKIPIKIDQYKNKLLDPRKW